MPPYKYQAQGTFRGTLLAPREGDGMPGWIMMIDSEGIERRSKVTFAPVLKKWLNKPENKERLYQENTWRCYPRYVKMSEDGIKKNYLFLHLFALDEQRDCKIFVTGILKRISASKKIASVLVPRNLDARNTYCAGTLIVFLQDGMADKLTLGDAVSVTAWLNGSQLTATSIRQLGKPIPFKRQSTREKQPAQ
jgi:hypothetical protein